MFSWLNYAIAIKRWGQQGKNKPDRVWRRALEGRGGFEPWAWRRVEGGWQCPSFGEPCRCCFPPPPWASNIWIPTSSLSRAFPFLLGNHPPVLPISESYPIKAGACVHFQKFRGVSKKSVSLAWAWAWAWAGYLYQHHVISLMVQRRLNLGGTYWALAQWMTAPRPLAHNDDKESTDWQIAWPPMEVSAVYLSATTFASASASVPPFLSYFGARKRRERGLTLPALSVTVQEPQVPTTAPATTISSTSNSRRPLSVGPHFDSRARRSAIDEVKACSDPVSALSRCFFCHFLHFVFPWELCFYIGIYEEFWMLELVLALKDTCSEFIETRATEWLVNFRGRVKLLLLFWISVIMPIINFSLHLFLFIQFHNKWTQ